MDYGVHLKLVRTPYGDISSFNVSREYMLLTVTIVTWSVHPDTLYIPITLLYIPTQEYSATQCVS